MEQLLGYIPVDAGMVVIGDSCNITDREDGSWDDDCAQTHDGAEGVEATSAKWVALMR
jgi:hypothetical protein